MMSKRKSAGSTERIVERELTSLEEQVVRMRKGLKAPHGLELDHKAGRNAALEAKLDAIERRVIEAAGARSNPTKRKIVSALRHKGR